MINLSEVEEKLSKSMNLDDAEKLIFTELREALRLLREAREIITQVDSPIFKADECGCPSCEETILKERKEDREKWLSEVQP